ncbi:MAG: homoserine kinase, partial [Acidimicrobiia bacterium]
RLAMRIEGHADNVLPALFGGVVLHLQDSWMRFDPVRTIQPVVLSAPGRFKTEDARRVLPVEVPSADAVSNASATAALIATLTGQQPPEALFHAMEDRVHQPYRFPLMQSTLDLYEALRGKGIPTALAGSGPSLICLVPAESVNEVTRVTADILPEGWQIITPGWDLDGAQVR